MKRKLILIGASTGGPGHIKKILSSLGSDFKTPIIIAQHMNSIFISTFVLLFDDETGMRVFETRDGMEIEDGKVYICNKSISLKKSGYSLKIEESNKESLYNPSIDLLFNSALDVVDNVDIMAVLLTGIGDDGAKGLSNLQKKGAICIAESEESAIVYGMPKKAVELNPQIKSKSLKSIIDEIKKFDKNSER